MRRGAGFWDFAQFQKFGEGAVVLAIKVRFEAMRSGERAGVLGQAAKGNGDEGGAGRDGRVIAAGPGYLAAKGGGLNSPRTQQMPAGEGHGLDQSCFGGVTRLKFGLKFEDESCGEGVIAAQRFALESAFESGGVGKESAERSVLRRNSFAFRRDGPSGFGGVGAIGCD